MSVLAPSCGAVSGFAAMFTHVYLYLSTCKCAILTSEVNHHRATPLFHTGSRFTRRLPVREPLIADKRAAVADSPAGVRATSAARPSYRELGPDIFSRYAAQRPGPRRCVSEWPRRARDPKKDDEKRTHAHVRAQTAEKITDTKKSTPKTCIGTFSLVHGTPGLRVCVLHLVRTRAKLSTVYVCVDTLSTARIERHAST
ncbi:hypothetical protein EVAR_10434_1 [Eumeta japonica]|uniref:Uncharacterized protein n=1 Tax=Eumeta variegata TaxID=151549 RepID=A0A4C1UDL1_EUMVA|nr:hypothetical protein EVAR_10434_1 [Eumeta japonica]